jgi:hypothetical protein
VVAFAHNVDVSRAAFVSIYVKVHSSGPQVLDRQLQGPLLRRINARFASDQSASLRSGIDYKLDRDEASHANRLSIGCARCVFKLGRSWVTRHRTASVTAPLLF